MLLFGHAGLTVAGVRTADPKRELRLPILLALLPDMIDKPLRVLAPTLVHSNTRNFGHTALAALGVLALLTFLRRRVGDPLLLWGCWLGHLVLDRLWRGDNPQVFLWPLLGPFPPPAGGHFIRSRLGAYNLAGEAVGLAILAVLAYRHRLREPARLRAFLRTGLLEPR